MKLRRASGQSGNNDVMPADQQRSVDRIIQPSLDLSNYDDMELDVAALEAELDRLQQSNPVATDFDSQRSWQEFASQHRELLDAAKQQSPRRSHPDRARWVVAAAILLLAAGLSLPALRAVDWRSLAKWGEVILLSIFGSGG